MRGYEWKKGSMLIADSPAEMVKQLIKEANSIEQIDYWKKQTEMIADNGPDQIELTNRIRYTYE
jgi:virulence-associated protein VapD